MKVASFEPVVGECYDFQDMTMIQRGTFRGFIRHVYESECSGQKIYPQAGAEPLLLFELDHDPVASHRRYRYAGVHVRIRYDVVLGRVDFLLTADHFGYTVEEIGRHGPPKAAFWKLVESSGE